MIKRFPLHQNTIKLQLKQNSLQLFYMSKSSSASERHVDVSAKVSKGSKRFQGSFNFKRLEQRNVRCSALLLHKKKNTFCCGFRSVNALLKKGRCDCQSELSGVECGTQTVSVKFYNQFFNQL